MSKATEDTKLSHVYKLLHAQIAGGQSRDGAKLPTEHELAERLGYSRATIARAIRLLVDQGLVERRKRAGTFVRVSGKPKTSLFAAMMGRTLPIDRSDNVFAAVSQEIAHQAEENSCALMVHDPGFKATTHQALMERSAQITDQLISRRVAGVFLLPHPIEEGDEESLSARFGAEFDRAQIPVVLIDRDIYRYPRRSHYDVVGIDNKHAGYVLTEHLLSLGCRKIDFIAPESYASAAAERVAGYIQALWDHGIQPAQERCHTVEHSDRHDAETALRRDRIEQILCNCETDAFIIANDGMAAEIMQIAIAMGKRIPQDFRMAAFDDLPQSKYLAVPLTTIRQPTAELGAVAMQTMLARIQNPARKACNVTVNAELVVRESCGAGR